MGAWPKSLKSLAALFLLSAVFAPAMLAKDGSSRYPLRITVLSAESHVLDAGAAPVKNCTLMAYSSDCNGSTAPPTQNILLVQDSDGKSFRITCTADSKWSECEALSPGETIYGRKEKRGITVSFRNSKGKQAKQFYEYVAEISAPSAPASARSPQPGAAPSPSSSTATPAPTPVPTPTPAAAPATAPASAPAPAVSPAPATAPVRAPAPPARAAQESPAEKVKVNFASTPPGAEITLDGSYVGSTPSSIVLSAGTHSVVFSLPGFAQWKRELTVLAGSDLTVSAILQKDQ
jgi:hypothetical protein